MDVDGSGRVALTTVNSTNCAPTAPVVLRYTATSSVLDPSFGNGGVAEVGPQLPSQDRLDAIGRLSTGKMIAVGVSEGRVALARLHADGTLDSTYAGDGTALHAMLMPAARVTSATVLSDDAILIAVDLDGSYAVGTVLMRFTADGTLDSTYGSAGVVSLGARATGISVLPDGRAAVQTESSSTPTFAVVVRRLTSGGQGDLTFGSYNGQSAYEPPGPVFFRPGAIALLPSGAVLAVEQTVDSHGDPAGNLMQAFSPGGVPQGTFVDPSIPTLSTKAAPGVKFSRVGSRTILSGSACADASCSNHVAFLAAYTEGFALDRSFAQDGATTFDPVGGSADTEVPMSVAGDAAGNVYAFVSWSDATNGPSGAVASLLASGQRNTGFGTNAIAPLPSAIAADQVVGLAVDAAARPLLAIDAPAADPDFAVTALTAGAPTPAPAAGGFVGITPSRILDTRQSGQGPCLGSGATRNLMVRGVGGVPTAGVGAVELNVTVTAPTLGGYLTVWPAGEPLPTASNLNFVAGQTVPNLVVAKVGANGEISIFNQQGCTHVVVDVVGWYRDGTSAAGGLTALTPSRLLDTRLPGQGPCVGPGATRNLTVTGVGGVPASGVAAVVMNVTATQPTLGGFLTVWPAGESLPTASNLNFAAGQTTPNLVVAKVGTNGQISIFNQQGCTHVIVDVIGWYRDRVPAAGGLTPLTPSRLLDTRLPGQGPCVGPGATRNLTVTGVGGVPASGVGTVVVNVTVTQPTDSSFMTVWPAGLPLPLASNLNFSAGETIPNLVTAKVGADGQISFYNWHGCAHLVVDVVGWLSDAG